MDNNAPIRLPQEDLRRLQLIELDILLELDRICRKHNIQYFLGAGTVLGAVRHKGFIPWDDDLDTYMMRDEYDKFCQVCLEELDTDKFFLQNASTDKEYRWGYAKLRRKDSLYLRYGQDAIKCMSGVSIDIFVMDKTPVTNVGMWCQFWIRRACIKTLWSVIGVTQDPSAFKRGVYRLLRHVPKELPLAILESMGRRNNKKENSKYIHCISFFRKDMFLRNNGSKGEYFSKWFEKTTEIEFEGFYFWVCGGYLDYLNYKYSNIWEFPPENQRLVHPPKEYNFDVDIELRGRNVEEYMNHEYLFLTEEDYWEGING